MHKLFRLLLCLLSFFLLLVVSGCNDRMQDEGKTGASLEIMESENIYNRYDISETQDMSCVMCVKDIDGVYTNLGIDDKNNFVSYVSTDGGLNWTLDTRWALKNKEDFISTADMADDGTIACVCTGMSDDGEILYNRVVLCEELTENERKMNISSKVLDSAENQIVSFDEDSEDILKNMILISDKSAIYVYYQGSVQKYDMQGNKQFEIQVSDFMDFCETESGIAILSVNSLYQYDRDGNLISEDMKITNALSDDISATLQNMGENALSVKRIIKTWKDRPGVFYLVLENGIYKYNTNDDTLILMVNEKELSSSDTIVYDFIITDD